MTPERWAQIEALFHRAAECAPKDRTVILDEACVCDSELRREVEALLSSDGSAGGSVRAAVRVGLTDTIVGRKLLHYRILEKIGQGGMGEVYRAHDERLERHVAIKVLPQSAIGNEASRKRFRKEALALSRLNHPNIATVFDFDSSDDIDLLVIEYIPGVTLSERLARGPLPETEALQLGIQLAEGLEAAHEQGLVHRDLKPGNLRITPAGRLKILDFGIACLIPAEEFAASRSAASLPGVSGTLPYMAPEQLNGGEADVRSDIWSAGAVLYEMLTGHRTFPQTSPQVLIDAILKKMPPTPSVLIEGIPSAMDGIVMKALRKDPAARYQSIREMRMDMERLSARLAAPRVSLRKAHPATQRLAILRFRNATGNPEADYLSEGICESLSDNLAQLPNLRVVSRTVSERYDKEETDPLLIGRELNVSAVLAGRITSSGDMLRIRMELIDATDNSRKWGREYQRKSANVLGLEQEIAQDVTAQLRLSLSGRQRRQLAKRSTENSEAHQLYLKGRFHWNKRTLEALRRGIDYFNQAIENDPAYAQAYAGLGDCYALLGWNSMVPPKEAFLPARAAALKALEIDEDLAEAHATLALIRLLFEWDWPEAEREFKRALELKPSYAMAHQFYGLLLAALGRQEEASHEAEQAQNCDPLSLSINTTTGYTFLLAGSFDLAAENCRKALELDANFAPAHFILGVACEQLGKFEEAVAECELAVRLSGRNSIMVAYLGHAYASADSAQKAEAVLEELQQRASWAYVPAYHLAQVLAGLGRIDETFELLEKARDERSTWLIFLNCSPVFKHLRSDPRHPALAQRIGLPPPNC